jgi:hypothetical protein
MLSLRTEARLLAVVLRRSKNQHRRTLYFRAFQRLHALVLRALAACEAVSDAHVRAKMADRSAHAFEPGGVVAACESALPLCERVLAPHTSAGFAALAVVLGSSAAVYLQSLRRINECLQQLSPNR